MKKMKKIISLVLAAVLVMSVCPLGLSTVASAASTPQWNAAQTTLIGSSVSATVSFSTENIRVTGGKGLYTKGNKIVAATPSGVPETTSAYSSFAYADESVVTPKIILTISQAADELPTVNITSGSSCSITPSAFVRTATGYECTIPTDGTATATAGSTLLVDVSYKINGTTYHTYGAIDVQYAHGGLGGDFSRVKEANATGGGYKARFRGGYRVLSKGLYIEVNGAASTNGGFTESAGSHRAFNFNVSESQIGYDNGTFHPTDGTNYHLGVYVNDNTSNKNPYNLGFKADGNRTYATVYIDKSTTSTLGNGDTGLHFRYQTFISDYASGNDVYATSFYVLCSYIGDITRAVSESDSSNSSGNTKSTYITQPNYGSGYSINSRSGKGTSQVQYFGGNLSSYANSTGSASLTWSWCPELCGDYDGNQAKVGTSCGFYFYVVDKTALKNMVKLVNTGTAFSTYTVNQTAGYNPQQSSYTASSWSTYNTAYRNAINLIANSKAKNQNDINTAVSNLYSAYNALTPLTGGSVTAHFQLQNGTNIYADSSVTGRLIGSTAACTAPDVPGYTLTSAGTQSVIVSSSNQDIYFTYAPADINYTFDPVITAAQPGAQTFGIAYKDANNQDMSFNADTVGATYNFYVEHMEIEGWYRSINKPSGVLTPGSYDADGNYTAGTYDQVTYSQKVTNVTVSTSPFTVYAKWVPAKSKVHYNLGTTGATMADTEYNPGSTIVQPADPSVSGYAFLGWYADPSLNTPYQWGQKIVYDDVTVYGKFEAWSNNIVLNPNGGTVEPTTVDVAGLAAGASITLPTPTRTGYTFNGWYLNNSFSGSALSGNAQLPSALVGGGVLYAKWTAKDVTINFDVCYRASGSAPVDTQDSPASISGKVDASISAAYTAAGRTIPGDPVRYGYRFGGWYKASSATAYTANSESQYNSAVGGNVISLVDLENGNFPATDDGSVLLCPVWVKIDTSAYIELDAYKEMYGEDVSVDTADLSTGDIITVRMKAKTNFYTGSTLFVYMYDSNFFELVGSGTDAFEVNDANAYVTAITGTVGTDYSGYTASPANANCPSGYKWIQIAIDPDVTGGVVNGAQINNNTWLVTFRLRIKATAPGSSGTVYMSEDWARTPDNNAGTMFMSWLKNATEKVWNGKNNVVTPDFTLATATVTLPQTPITDATSKITADPNGGVWPDNSTGTKDFTGNVGEIISIEANPVYAAPTRRGYSLGGWYVNADPTQDEWIAGYYGSAAQNNKTFKAYWIPASYNITWHANNENASFANNAESKVDTLGYDATYNGPSTVPTYQGYTVTGWSLTPGGEAVTFPQTMSDEDVEYFAIWGPATDTPVTVIVHYTNNATGVASTQNKSITGTTGATIHLVEDSSSYTNTLTDNYISYSDLPSVQNGNYIFDPNNANNEYDVVVAADGSSVIDVYYRGKVYSATFDANGGTYTVPSVSSYKDSFGVGYEYTSNTSYVISREFNHLVRSADDQKALFTGTIYVPNDGAHTGVPTYVLVEDEYIQAETTGDYYAITFDTPQISKTGYTLVGWGNAANATTAVNIASNTANKTYYAIWQGMTVTNTFNACGGSFSGASTFTKNSVYGQTIVVPTASENPTRAGYEFLGWSRTEGAAVAETLGTENSTTGETFYAVWKLTNQTYNINVYYMGTNGQYGTPAIANTASGIGAVSINAADYAQEGFTFDSTNTSNKLSATLDASTAGSTVTLAAYFSRNKYNVTFINEGQTYGTVQSLYYEQAITAPATNPTKTGYSFKGWSATQGGTVLTDLGTVEIDGNTFYAVYQINSYTVTYKSYDGTAQLNQQTYNYGAPITAYDASAVTMTGYSFAGWATTTEQSTGTNNLGNMPANDVTYYMAFAPNNYTATFISDGATYTTTSVQYNTAITAPTAPTKTGYTFDGWAATENGAKLDSLGIMDSVSGKSFYARWTADTHDYTVKVYYMGLDGTYNVTPEIKTKSGTVDSTGSFGAYDYAKDGFGALDTTLSTTSGTIPATGTLELSAYYPRNTYTITYRSNNLAVTFSDAAANQTSCTTSGNRTTRVDTYYFGETVVPAVPVKEGYTLTVSGVPETMTAGNINITITNSANEYTATFISDGATFTTAAVNFNSAITAPETNPTKTGYTFIGWSRTEGASAADASLGVMDSVQGVRIYAIWSINSYTATFYDYNGTQLGTTSADYNTAVTAYTPDPSREGYTFKGWSATQGGAKLESLGNMPVNGTSFYAYYEVNTYTFTVNVDGVKTETPYEFGAAVTTPTTPTKTGYTFASWSPEVPATMPAQDIEVVAQWNVNQHTFTVNVDGVKTETPYNYGATITTPTSPSKTGYTFAGWSPEVPATMPDNDVEVVAQWEINSYNLTIHYVYADNTTASADYTDTVDYNDTYSVNSPAITGFTPDQATVAGTMGAADVTVTVKYTANKYNFTVHYEYSNGTTAKPDYTAQIVYNTAYSAITPEIEGYTPDKASVAGTMGAADVEETVVYSINSYTLTVTYELSDGATAPQTHTESVEYNAAYSVTSPTVSGYTPETAVVSGTMPADNVSVNVRYNINSYNLTVKYEYENGDQAKPDYTTTVAYKDTYTKVSPSITGYTPDQATVTGTMGTEDVEITVTYSINSYDLTIHYVYADNTTASADYTETVDYNDTYSVTSPVITGYTPDQATVTGTMGTEAVEKTVKYTVNKYTMTFVAPVRQADGTLSTVDMADASTYTVIAVLNQDYNTAVTAPAATTIQYYTFSDWATTVPATMPAEDTVIVAAYTRVPVTLTIDTTASTVIETVDDPTTEFTGYIYGLDNKLSQADFENEYVDVVGDGHLQITLVEAYSDYDLVGTGTKVELIDDVTEEVVATYYVVVFGDLNGDGMSDTSDVQIMRAEIASTPINGALWSVDSNGIALDPDDTAAPILKAADLNGDGNITSADLTNLRNVVNRRSTIDQSTGAVAAR